MRAGREAGSKREWEDKREQITAEDAKGEKRERRERLRRAKKSLWRLDKIGFLPYDIRAFCEQGS
jgi:hypothetical protein